MAARVNRPLPTVPVDESDYQDPGFEEGEFTDGEDYENDEVGEIPEAESTDDDEDDYLEPETSAEDRPALPPRQPTWGRRPPPPPKPTNDAPVCPPRNKPQPSEGQVLPPRRSSAPLPFEHDSVPRPGLPAPLPQEGEEEYMAPEPTEEYSEISGGVELSRSQSAPAPPQIPDDLYQDMPETAPEVMNMSSMQKEILAKKLTTSTRELPQTPKQNKAPKGFKMVAGLDTIVIKDVKVGLRRVAKDVFDQKSSKRDSNAPDPSLGGVRSKATMFGQKMVPPTPLREPRTIIRDKVRGSTTSNTSNRSDSGVDVCDVMRDIAPQASSTRPPTVSSRPPTVSTRSPTVSTLQHTSSMRPPMASPVPVAHRTLPPLPSEETNKVKTSLPSRPLPNVPKSSSEGLSKYPWFFGNLERSEEASKIKAMRQDGAYLVRTSKRDPATPYTLTILYNNKIWHLHIRSRRDGKFAIGFEKVDEECFDSVPELIEHHMQFSIILAGRHGEGGETRLTKHPRK